MTFELRQPDLWRQLERLRFRVRLEDGRLLLTGPPGTLPPEIALQIRACRDDLVADLGQRESLRIELERNIRSAASWLDLETAIAIATEGHQAAVLNRWQVTRLTELAIIVARRIPAEPPRVVRSRAEIGLFSDRKRRRNDAERTPVAAGGGAT